MLARRSLTLHSRSSLLLCREYADGSGAYLLLDNRAATFGIYPQAGARVLLECEYTPGSQLRDTSQLGSGLYDRVWELARLTEWRTGQRLEPAARGEVLLFRPQRDLLQDMYGAALPVLSSQAVRTRPGAARAPTPGAAGRPSREPDPEPATADAGPAPDPGARPPQDLRSLVSPTAGQVRELLPDPSIVSSGGALTGALLDENGCALIFLDTARVNFVIRIPPHNQHLFSIGIRTLSPYATEKREIHALRMFHFDALRYSNACTNNGILVVGYGLAHCLAYELIATSQLRYLLPPLQRTGEDLGYQNLKIPGLEFPSGGVFRRFYLTRSDRDPSSGRPPASEPPSPPHRAARPAQPGPTKYDLLHGQQPFQMPPEETELDRCCGAAALDYRCLPEVFLSDEKAPQLQALVADLARAATGELLGLQMYTLRPVPPRKINFNHAKDSLFTINIITGSAGSASGPGGAGGAGGSGGGGGSGAGQREASGQSDAAILNKLLQALPNTRQSVKPDVSTYLALFDSSDALLGSLINRAYRDHNITGVYCQAHDVGLSFDEMLRNIRKLVKAKIYNSVISCLNCNFLICVTGSPGSGKTSLVKSFLDEDIACSGQEDTFTSVDRVVRYLGGNYSHPFAIDFEDLLLQLSRGRLRAIQTGNYFSFFEGQLSCYDPSVLGCKERALALNLYTNLATAHYRKFGAYLRDKPDKAFAGQVWPCYLWYRDSILGVARKSITIVDCDTTMRNLLALYGWLLTVLGNIQERHCASLS